MTSRQATAPVDLHLCTDDAGTRSAGREVLRNTCSRLRDRRRRRALSCVPLHGPRSSIAIGGQPLALKSSGYPPRRSERAELPRSAPAVVLASKALLAKESTDLGAVAYLPIQTSMPATSPKSNSHSISPPMAAPASADPPADAKSRSKPTGRRDLGSEDMS